MFEIEKLNNSDYEQFTNMFLDYFINDLGVEQDENLLRENLVKNFILKQYAKGLIFIDVIKEQNQCLGFNIYQIDSENADWSERIGWGFIREIYVAKSHRKFGLGTKLLSHAENVLKNLGVTEVYLTSDENDYVKKFYLKNGYKTDNVKAKNGLDYYEKKL